MKNIAFYSILMAMVAVFTGCDKSKYGNYPGAEVSPYISIYDLKSQFKGSPVPLTPEVMFGSRKIAGIVLSDHSGNNVPEGILVLQDARRLNQNRGIAVNIGADAAKYHPGDSVTVDLVGGTMERINGSLQITGLNGSVVTKLGTGTVSGQLIGDVKILEANLDMYENTLVTISQAEFDPPASEGDTFAGDKKINNGSGLVTLHTEANAEYVSKPLPYLGTYSGLVLGDADGFRIWPRTANDIIVLSEEAPAITPVVITGFLNNSDGTDENQEYIQLMATRDIDFSVTPMAVVTCNNAGNAGAPANGWAIGGSRSYKFNLTSGTVKKGAYFYVGGNKNINGPKSTDISAANWIVSRTYTSLPGDDFGASTSNLLANSGNPAGIAVFNTIEVTSTTEPVDVVFFGQTSNSNSFSAGPPPIGYRITNTDYYEKQNSTVPTLDDQPFYLMGSNTFKLVTVNDENFRLLGGVYNTRTGRWPVKRFVTPVPLPETATLSDIETNATTITDK